MLTRQRKQLGLSLVWTAVWSALLAILVIGGLFSMRYERNMFFEAINKFVGSPEDIAKKSQEIKEQATSTATGKAPPPKFDGKIHKCQVNGQTVYSQLPCEGKGGEIKLHDNTSSAPKPSPTPTAAPMNATDRAIERATR